MVRAVRFESLNGKRMEDFNRRAAGLKKKKTKSLATEEADEGNPFEWGGGDATAALLFTICKCAVYTHTQPFGHEPGRGVNGLTGGWTASTVETHYFLKGRFMAFFKK